MATLPAVEGELRLRARRWDCVIVGGGIAALTAAARLGLAGHRVLVVEEAAAASLFAGVREPFLLSGALDGGALDACLRDLALPLLDRRRIREGPVALQVAGDDLRADVGEPALTADELVAWGLAKPDEARALVRALRNAGEAERRAMLAAPVVRAARRLGVPRPGAPSSPISPQLRGLPDEAVSLPPALARLLAAQVRALSNLAAAAPMPEARVRLLSSPLAGGAEFRDRPPWLHGLLRRRVESVYGEFRSVSRPFRLVTVDGQPGVAVHATHEVWVGRALVLAAPLSALAAAFEEDEAREGEQRGGRRKRPRLPGFLRERRTVRRRRVVLLSAHRDVVPEAMCRRVVLPGEAEDGSDAISIAGHPHPDDPDRLELVARAVPTEGADPTSVEDAIEARVRALLPFSEARLVRRELARPRWDDDDWLEDPPPGGGWPGEAELRVSSRPPVYRLDRAAVAGLGVEGDLLLGWRGGDALAAEL